jgi:hypothetical protein
MMVCGLFCGYNLSERAANVYFRYILFLIDYRFFDSQIRLEPYFAIGIGDGISENLKTRFARIFI